MFQYKGRSFILCADSGAVRVADTETNQWVTDVLTDRERSAATSALIAEHSAMTYLWGRQDAGESDRDTDVAIAFGRTGNTHTDTGSAITTR